MLVFYCYYSQIKADKGIIYLFLKKNRLDLPDATGFILNKYTQY